MSIDEQESSEMNSIQCQKTSCNNSDCEEKSCCGRMTEREEKLKSGLINRLNRAEGQIRGIKGMVEKDVYCDDILHQIAAVQSALNSISKLVLENHIKGCLVTKIKNGEDDIVNELINTIGKLL